MYMSQAKGSSQRAMGRHLKNSLNYILNPEKTRMGTLVGGNHILPDTEYAFQQMLDTKKIMEERYGHQKTKGRQGYHFVLSFSPKDEITPEMALEITEKFVKAYIPDYEAVFAVHDNTEKIHSHIVFNSVDIVKGKKFHTKNTEWQKRLQPIVNQLCKEYGLSTIDIPGINGKTKEPALAEAEVVTNAANKTKQKNYAQWEEEKRARQKGIKTKTELIREEIWECLHIAKSRQEFDQEMKKRGYVVKRKNKKGENLEHTAVLAPERKKNQRLDKEQEELLKSLPEYRKKTKKEKRIEAEQKKKGIIRASLVKVPQPEVKKEWMDKIDRFEEQKDSEKTNRNVKWGNYKKTHENSHEKTSQKAEKEYKTAFVKAGRKNVVHTSKMQQSYLVIQSISKRYILYDYRKRKYGKYYREYVKFSQTQQKIKYLHANNIKTMEQLEKRREELACLQDKLKLQKQEIFQERKQYVKVFRLYKELENLRMPVKLYCDGDAAFAEEYHRMKKILEQIKRTGLSVEEVQKKYVDYKQSLSSFGKIERMAQKEAALCEEIWQENKTVRNREEVLGNDKTRKAEREKSKIR